ncbi:MAG: hypothetical protein IJ735_00495 [Clostridia bacterium]|nr:hypothetical protein [Clostridia bacterium]
MTKKLFTTLLVSLMSLLLVFACVACGDKSTNSDNGTSADNLLDFSEYVHYEASDEGDSYIAYIEDENPYFFQKLLKVAKNIDIQVSDDTDSLPEETQQVLATAFKDIIDLVNKDLNEAPVDFSEYSKVLSVYPKLSVTIHEEYNGKPVTALGDSDVSIFFMPLIRELHLPKTLKRCAFSFLSCWSYSLEKIVIDPDNSLYSVINEKFIIQRDRSTLVCVPQTTESLPSGIRYLARSAGFALGYHHSEVTIPEDYEIITDIRGDMLQTISLPHSLNHIVGAFHCENLTTINYNGTIVEWNAILRDDNWDSNISEDYCIHCTDGDISRKVE